MKKTLLLMTCFFLSFASFAGDKDTYKGPKFKLSAHPVVDPEVKDPDIEKEGRFKIQEGPQSERNVASDEEEDVRGPSSDDPKKPVPKKQKEFLEIGPSPWIFDKRI